MHRLRLPLVCLLTATLFGCSGVRQWRQNGFKLGPDYLRPAVPVAQDWVDSADPSFTYDHCVQTSWWRAFNDPTLEQLIIAAYQQNLPLRTAGLRVLEARHLRRITAGNIFPQSQATFSQYSRNQLSQTTATPLPVRAFDDWQTGFDLSWEIDVWGRLRRAIESSDAAIDVEIENYDNILVTLIGDVASTYIQLRSFDERLRLAEQNVQLQTGSLRIAQARFDGGRVDELDVQQAKANLADTRASIPSLKQGRRLAVNGLAILLGTTPYEIEPILAERGSLPDTPEQIVVGIPADLLRRRPDVRSSERQIAQQSAQIGIAEADLYPQFGINGEIKLNSKNFSDLFSTASTAGFVAPGFRWNILNYGRLVNNVHVQELRYQQSILNYENTVLAAHREVEDAMVKFLRSKERAAELQKSVDAAEKSVELVLIQYTEGATDFGRVFVLEANLARAQDNLVATQAEVSISLTQIYKALGGGWQIRCDIPYCGNHSIQAAVTQDRASTSSTPPSSDFSIPEAIEHEQVLPDPPAVEAEPEPAASDLGGKA